MSRILEQKFSIKVPEIIASWLEGDKGKVSLEKRIKGQTVDLIQKTHGYTFIVEWKSAGTLSLIASTISQLKELVAKMGDEDVIPIVAVPFMGEAGRRLYCGERPRSPVRFGSTHLSINSSEIQNVKLPRLTKLRL
jgi:hypothetical protein